MPTPDTATPPIISLVCTVKNEADSIGALLDSMLAQTRPPDEIVVNDCGSSDATVAIVEGYIARGHAIRLVHGGHNIPSGRNNAIGCARGAIVACTDAGLTLDRHWLEWITQPLLDGQADVVGGFFHPAPRSLFEFALAATNYRDAGEIDAATFLPFGQSVAFRRTAWEQAGGYPEWASHCEDLLFDMALQRAGMRFAFEPRAFVNFEPRSSFAAFARQYFNYARGDGVAGLWPKRHLARYATYMGGTGLALVAARKPWVWLLHLAGVYAYCRTPWQRIRRRAPNLPAADFAHAALLVPLIRVVGDMAKMAGYPAGLLRRWRSPQLKAAQRAYWARWR